MWLACLVVVLPESALGQDGVFEGEQTWQVIEIHADGAMSETMPWPPGVGTPETHADWQGQLLAWYQDQAWYKAGIDSWDEQVNVVRVRTGPKVHIASMTISGSASGWAGDQVTRFEGEPATRAHIENLLGILLEEGTRRGHLAATARVDDLSMANGGLDVHIHVEAGPLTRLEDVVLEGDERTRRPAFLSAIGLSPGQVLDNVDLNSVRSQLATSGMHEQVSLPRFELLSDSQAVMVIPVLPLPPGQFDLVVGALPATEGNNAQVIGSGHLLLSNAFGRGRTIEARINRLPGQAASALLAFESPAPGGWPFRLQVGLQGHQQDSTWNESSTNAKVLYRLDGATWLGASFSAERTRAGFSGSEFEGAAQAIPRSSARMGGVTMRLARLDHPRFPQRGIRLETTLERGVRSIRTREIINADTVSVRRSERRERLSMDLDLYLMSGQRLGWAMGVDASAIRAGRPDASELLFIGGAGSLRGYDENRFRGTAVARAFFEGRWYVDRSSWGFVFFDAGWVAIDADFESGLPAILNESEGFHPGYGFGFVFSSAVGPISLSYALNPEESLSQGRVHVGLSFGL